MRLFQAAEPGNRGLRSGLPFFGGGADLGELTTAVTEIKLGFDAWNLLCAEAVRCILIAAWNRWGRKFRFQPPLPSSSSPSVK
jgi:hypothetical protein